MPRVAVVSDTTGYLPAELVAANGIHLVSCLVNHGDGRVEAEADMPNFADFYDALRSAERMPTTAPPPPERFVDAFEPLLAEGHDVVSIHLSSALSQTLEAAREAAARLAGEGRGGERVHVVDSRTAAGGLGVLALVAARRAAAGDDAHAVLARIEDARAEWRMWYCLDTLEFLRRGGRIGPLSAWIGSTLRVKPILTVEAEITPVERVRTTERALERIVDYARQRNESGADAWMVQHSRWPELADELAGRCREVFGAEPVFVSEIGPVLGVHTGPCALGMGALPARFLA